MHSTNPRAAAFRAYTGGGTRGVVDKADDTNYLQTFGGNFMAGESRKYVEAPQNYGFTSVNMGAEKDEKTGKIKSGAEHYGSFSHGNRSMGWGIIDDPRHRLYKLIEGAVAMYCPKEWGQQFLLHKAGMFLTGNAGDPQGQSDEEKQGKKIRIQLVKNKNNQQQQQSQQQQANGGGTGTSGSGQQTQQKKMGQETLHEEESTTFIDVTSERHHHKRGDGNVWVEDKEVAHYYKDKDISTRVTDKHVHIRYKDYRVFVDESGCWSTHPIQIKTDPDTASAGAAATHMSVSESELRWKGILSDPGRIEMATLLQQFSGPTIDEWVDRNVTNFEEMKTALKSLLKAQART